MAGVLQHLRSSTLNKRPNPSSMVDGQVAINYASGAPGMFFKDSNGALVKVGPVHVGSGAPNAVPASGGTAGNSLGEQWLDTSGGTYVFKIWDGSAWRSEAGEFVNVTGDTMTGALGIIAGSASSPSLFFSGDTNTGLYSPGADQVAISTSSVGRLFIDASGNVSVGTTTKASNTHFDLYSTSSYAQYIRFRDEVGAPGLIGYSHTDDSMQFYTSGLERIRVDSSGRLGLGTSSPGYTLDVNGVARSTGTSAMFALSDRSTGTGDRYGIYSNSNTFRIYDFTAAADRLSVDSLGRVGIGVTGPSYPLTVKGSIGLGVASNGTVELSFDNSIVGDALTPAAAIQGLYTAYGSTSAGALIFKTNSAAANATEKARIDSSGRLLVGTSTAPTIGQGQYSKLVVQAYVGNSTGAGTMTLQRGQAAASIASGDRIGELNFTDNAGATYGMIYCDADAAGGTNDYPGRLVFSTTADGASSPTERMRITQAGIVLIGATGLSGSTPDSAGVSIDQDGAFRTRITANGNYQYEFNNATGSLVGYIQVNSGSVTYSTTSDYRLKENLQPLAGAAERIKQLPVYRFNFISDPDTQVDGFVAHEVQAVVPEAISGTKDAVHEDGSINPQGIDQSKLVPLLTAALQEAIGRIETLEVKVAALKTS